MNESEIRAEVEKRKQRAKELRLDQIVFRLWRDHLRYLQEDFDHEQDSMPQSLTKVVRTKLSDRRRSGETIELLFGNTCMAFSFEEHNTTMPDGDIWISGNIRVSFAAKTVFDLRCRHIHDE